MLSLSRIGENKKGLSNLVAYVLLIAITISLSVMVYGWLKFYVSGNDGAVETCPSNVNIVIDSYSCIPGSSGNITISLKNKGLFDIDGFVIRVHNRTGAEFGYYSLNDTGAHLSPGEVETRTYDFLSGMSSVSFIDVQPFLTNNGDVSCVSYTSQRVNCV